MFIQLELAEKYFLLTFTVLTKKFKHKISLLNFIRISDLVTKYNITLEFYYLF